MFANKISALNQTNATPLVVIEMTSDGVSKHVSQAVYVARLGENRNPQGARRVAAFGRFLDEKDKLFHAAQSSNSVSISIR
jgi:hypothetical protein